MLSLIRRLAKKVKSITNLSRQKNRKSADLLRLFETFWDLLRLFETFWDLLRLFETFWSRSEIPALYKYRSLQNFKTGKMRNCCHLLSTEPTLTKLGLKLDLPKGSPDPPWNSASASIWPHQRLKTAKIRPHKSGSTEAAWRLRPHFSLWSVTSRIGTNHSLVCFWSCQRFQNYGGKGEKSTFFT